jgi:hypothetical protein
VHPDVASFPGAIRKIEIMMHFYALRQCVRAMATFCGAATRGCRSAGAIALAAAVLTSCIAADLEPIPPAIHTAGAPSPLEDYCAWFGDVRDGVLYFGQSAFWSAFRTSGGRATADLDHAGPALIGRFDLARERFLSPLDVTEVGDRSGVWDVLAHPNGRIYFTTYFASAGFADLATGEVRRFDEAGAGLNELAPGPDGNLLVSRYGFLGEPDRSGSVVLLEPDGAVLAEYPLTPPAGSTVAPKTVAYDGLREEIWVTTDLLPSDDAEARIGHDTYVLDGRGVQLRRIAKPEIQFIAFAGNGTGYRAEVEGHKLWLRILPPGPKPSPIGELRIPLEHAFASAFDFVQDIQITADGRAVVTRWSGWVHVVDATGAIHSLRLPPFEPRGVYYTATLHDHRICATHCRDVSIVCRDLD